MQAIAVKAKVQEANLRSQRDGNVPDRPPRLNSNRLLLILRCERAVQILTDLPQVPEVPPITLLAQMHKDK